MMTQMSALKDNQNVIITKKNILKLDNMKVNNLGIEVAYLPRFHWT